ncbi:MAG: ATP-binding protein [Vogesella sp.]|uniref:hybrid sensor histidine kinase/response regulator n=1 Tax=Vogesella sp. TaxID=1904252 RepID=UPI00391D023B
MIPTLLQQLRTQPIRARLQAAFVLLFVLMLVVIVVSVSAMRNTLDTLTGFREEVMPELARVLELAEKVSQIAAIAPSLADSYAPETLSRDINRLQALTREIRQLSQNLPPEADRQLAVSSMLEGAERDLSQLLLLSAQRRRSQQILNTYMARLDELGGRLAAQHAAQARRAPTLIPLWQTLLAVPLSRDRARLGELEASAEALMLAMARRGESAQLPDWLVVELEVMVQAPQNLFEQQRELTESGERIAVLLQLYRSNAEHLSRRTASYVQAIRQQADDRSGQMATEIRSGSSSALLLAAIGVAVAMLAAAYVRRVAQRMQAISSVMSRLAGGDTEQLTPATEQADEIGDLARAFQVFRDNLLEKQRLSHGIEAQRRLLQTVFRSMHDGLSVYDEDGKLMVWNPQFPAQLGMVPDCLHSGMPYTALRAAMPAGTRWEAVAGDTVARPDDSHRIASHAELHLPGGRVLEFMSHAMPEGGWVAVCRDVSARRAAEAQLQQMQKMEVLGQLTGGVAHDFNNILIAILGNLELLEQRADLPAEARQRLERAQAAANKAAALTRRLLAFARRQPLCTERVDVGDMLYEMLDLVEYSVSDGIRVSVDAPEGLVVQVDRGQLENAILNLALNAAQAMGEQGSLQLRVGRIQRDGRDWVAINVQDDGPGIPPEVLPHVLEPFFTTKAQGKGSGLGLSIVYGFVKQSGGELAIHSRQGEGTTVCIELPASAGQCSPQACASALPAVLPARHVLLVEDDADVRDTAQQQLAALGARVSVFASEAALLGWLAAGGEADLVLSDIMLGEGGDGVRLYRTLQAAYPALPVVLTSGLPPEHHARRSDWPAGVAFLAKPYRRDDLARLLAWAPLAP